MPNKYRTPYSKLIGALKNSATKKRNAGWSRQIGARFIGDDIEDIQYRKDGLRFTFGWCASQTIQFSDLNLRETEEALKWAEKKEAQWEYDRRTGTDDKERISRYKKYIRGKKRRWSGDEIQHHLAPRMR